MENDRSATHTILHFCHNMCAGCDCVCVQVNSDGEAMVEVVDGWLARLYIPQHSHVEGDS